MQGTGAGNVVIMQLYGWYLLNGGTYERFLDLTYDELQLMITVDSASRARDRNELMRGLARLMGAREV